MPYPPSPPSPSSPPSPPFPPTTMSRPPSTETSASTPSPPNPPSSSSSSPSPPGPPVISILPPLTNRSHVTPASPSQLTDPALPRTEAIPLSKIISPSPLIEFNIRSDAFSSPFIVRVTLSSISMPSITVTPLCTISVVSAETVTLPVIFFSLLPSVYVPPFHTTSPVVFSIVCSPSAHAGTAMMNRAMAAITTAAPPFFTVLFIVSMRFSTIFVSFNKTPLRLSP